MPSRDSSTKNLWMALVSSAIAARAQAAARVTRPPDLSEAVPVAEVLPRLLRVEPALVVDEHRGLLLPDAEHLRDLLLERHPREQVGRSRSSALRVRSLIRRSGVCRGAHVMPPLADSACGAQ